MSAPVPDCRTCGACCYGDERWIKLERGDDDRLGDLHAKVTVWVEHGRGYRSRAMRMAQGRCVAYSDALPDGCGVGCSIYGVRPAVCRELDAGSVGCLEARARGGIVE